MICTDGSMIETPLGQSNNRFNPFFDPSYRRAGRVSLLGRAQPPDMCPHTSNPDLTGATLS